MRKLWTIRWFRVLLGVVLTAALLAPVVLPALQMQRQEPENPIRKENIQPVRRLSFGDGDGGTLAAAPLTQETGTGGSQSGQEQNPEQPPEEQTGENVPEQLPEQPRSDPEPQPGQESSEQPGERTDGQPDDARRRDAARRTRPWPRTHLVPLRRGALSLTLPVGYDRAAGCAYCAAARWKAAL